MVLGSSETFGLYESPGAEFPAALARKLGQKYEVINAALTGMTIGSTVPYWTDWASRFSPALVVIYPSPFFYLNEGVVERRAPVADIRASQSVAASAAAESGYRDRLQSAVQGLRLVQRARERLDVPDFIQRWRDQRVIDEVTADKPPQWLFHEPPSDRADLLIRDLDALVTNVRARGAIPIVMTHASRFTDPPRERDMDWLERARVNTPRGTAVAIAQFETMVNTRLVEWASKSDVELIDIRPAIAGREELFGDLIHFNDAGAAAVASVIAAHVQTAGPRDRRQASVSAHRHAVQ